MSAMSMSLEGLDEVGVPTTAAPASAAPFPSALLYDPGLTHAHALAETLRRQGAAAHVVVVGARTPLAALDRHPADVGLIRLGTEGSEGLIVAAELTRAWPWVQIVFWTEDRTSAPEVTAARDLGIQRIVPASRLGPWIVQAMPPLARYARARREMLAAEASLPALPPLPAEPEPWPAAGPVDRLAAAGAAALRLPEAERRFREAYLRTVLSSSVNHRHAATKAGIPYTTLCSMIKKLGL